MEMFLPFGLRTSSFLFDMFAKSPNWMLLKCGHDTTHYLDDFLEIFASLKLAAELSHDFRTILSRPGYEYYP